MRSITNYDTGDNIILRNRQLVFNNLVAVVYDTRVTEDTLILVYYSEDSEAIARAAGLSVSTNNGNITFTAATVPTGTIVCDIVLLSANMVNVIADASNVDYSNSDSGLQATDVQGALDEVVEEKADKSDIALTFSTTTDYAKGDLSYYQGTLYEFNQNHAAGAWNSAHADAKYIDDILRNYATVHYQNVHSVTADGVKTYKQLINELFDGYTSYVSLGGDVCVAINQSRYSLNYRASTVYRFNSISSDTSTLSIDNISYDASGSHTSTTYNEFSLKSTGITITDMSSTAAGAGSIFRLYVRIRT